MAPKCTRPTPFGHWRWRQVQTIRLVCIWESHSVGGFQGLQDTHGQPLLIPGAAGRDARCQPMKYSTSGSPNNSADTPYYPVAGHQGLQDAHGLPLFVPGAGGVGARSQSIRYSASERSNKSDDTPYNPVGGPQGPRRHMAYPFWSLLLVL